MLQSIASPVIDHVITKEKVNKKGLKTTTTTRYALTGSQLAFLAVIWGVINLRTIMGGSGGLGSAAASAAEGAGSFIETISNYGLGFHYKWRGWSHDERDAFRTSIGKAGTWVPPGYPAFWS